jgi:hypothetical protein
MGLEDKKEVFPMLRNDVREIMGCMRHEILDAASADAVPSNQCCRYAECDADGIVKIDYLDGTDGSTKTVVKAVTAGGVIHHPNITKVYRYYTGTTAITAQVYNSAGSLVNGLRLIF